MCGFLVVMFVVQPLNVVSSAATGEAEVEGEGEVDVEVWAETLGEAEVDPVGEGEDALLPQAVRNSVNTNKLITTLNPYLLILPSFHNIVIQNITRITIICQ